VSKVRLTLRLFDTGGTVGHISRRLVGSGTASLTAASVVAGGSGGVFSLFTATQLGTTGRGELQRILVTGSIIALILISGAESALIYHLSRSLGKKEMAANFAVLAIIGSVIAILVAFRSEALPAAVAAMGIAVVLASAPLIGTRRFHQAAAIRGAVPLAACVGGVFGVVLVLPTATAAARGYVIGGAAAIISITCAQFGANLRLTARAWPPILELGSYVLRISPGLVAASLLYRVDQLVTYHVLGSAALGVYSLAVQTAEASGMLTAPIALLAFGELSRRSADDSPASPIMLRAYKRVFALHLAISVVGLGTLAALTSTVLPEFKGAMAPAAILVPASLSLSLGRVSVAHLNALNRPGIGTISTIAALVINVALVIVLAPPYGLIGVSVASMVAYGAHSCVLWKVSRRHLGKS
jgi:O-antigen/teichoic acid export membrane protein